MTVGARLQRVSAVILAWSWLAAAPCAAQTVPDSSRYQAGSDLATHLAGRLEARTTRVRSWLSERGIIGREFERQAGVSLVDVRRGRPVFRSSLDLTAAKTMGAHHLWPGGSLGVDVDAAGQIAGVWEYRGIPYVGHDEFDDGGGTTRVTVMDYGTHAANTDVGRHATQVSSLVAAAGIEPDAKGTAPGSLVHAYDDTLDVLEMDAAVVNDGLLVSNHAYGQVAGWWALRSFDGENTLRTWLGDPDIDAMEEYRFGFYDETSYDWDLLAFEHPGLSIVISAGNDRDDLGVDPSEPDHWVYTGTGAHDGWEISSDPRHRDGYPDGFDSILPGMQSAKNVLTIGALNNAATEDCSPIGTQMEVTDYSAWGPTDDGRIKPEFVAPGAGVFMATYSTSNPNGYVCHTLGGTSFSAPVIAGGITLINGLQDLLHDENADLPPVRFAATWKALLASTANDMGPPDPDYAYGFGRPDLATAATLLDEDAAAGSNRLVVEDTLAQHTTYQRTFFPVPGETLSVAVSWTDPPGSPISRSEPPAQWLDRHDIPMLVNDLELTLTDTSGTIHYPWSLDPLSPSLPADNSGANHVDNLELVDVKSPLNAPYTAMVAHSGTLENGNQAFSLVADGAYPCGTLLDLKKGWNLVSFACMPADSSRSGLIPEALELYHFDGAMTETTLLSSGVGYWAKVTAPVTRSVGSFHRPANTRSVVEGWNLIGGFDENVSVDDLVLSDGLTLSSELLWYDPATALLVPAPDDLLRPGKAYWVKCDAAGSISY